MQSHCVKYGVQTCLRNFIAMRYIKIYLLNSSRVPSDTRFLLTKFILKEFFLSKLRISRVVP